MLTSDRITKIRALHEAATPGPWQRSYFIDKYHRMTDAEKQRCREQESLTIRGPGTVGTPLCNTVLVFAEANIADIEFIVAARQDIPDLLDALEAETARANANRSEAILIDQNSAAKDMEYEKETVALTADRDRWKARAEALERAAVGHCLACKHIQDYITDEPCCDCLATDVHGKHWVFDEAKFAVDPETAKAMAVRVKHDRRAVGDYRCPNCNAAVFKDIWRFNYCGSCGLRLDWSDCDDL